MEKIYTKVQTIFENPGKKIKTISIIVFCLVTVLCVILAFVLGMKYYPYYYGKNNHIEFNAPLFFGLLIGAPLTLYISTLFLVGFGDLVENSAKEKNET